jgi:cytochrome c5
MKKLLSALFILSLIIIACSKKTVATKNIPVNTSSEISSDENSKSNSEATEASVLAAGKTIYETKCTRCHGMKSTASYTIDRWDGILKLMAPKAKLIEIETEQVTAYVRANAKN